MSRLRTPLALLAIAALVALSTALVACGGGSDGGGDPQTVIDDATLEGIESGVVDLTLAVDAKGREGGNLDVDLSGPFDAATEEGEKPQFDLSADVSGSFGDEEIDFEGGLVLLPNSAYVEYQGTEYEVDPTTFSFVESALEQAQQEGGAGGGSTDVTACQEAATGLKVANFVDNLKDEGEADVGGTSTTKVSGDLDVSGALDSLVEIGEDPACRAQLGAAGPLPSKSEVDEAKGEVEEALKTARVDVYVGDDDIVRQISAQLTIEPPKGHGDDVQSVEVAFDLRLTGVNEEQEIAAPADSKPLSDLFLKLGINPIELLGLLQGEGGADIGGLLESLGGVGGGSDGGGSGGASPQAYLDCLQGVRTAADLQKCAQLR